MANATMVPYHKVSHSWCLGTAHRVQRKSLDECMLSCRQAASCQCMHYRALPSEANCRWVGHDFQGTATSKAGFTAWIREGAKPAHTVPEVPPAPCGAGSGLALRTRALTAVPSFYAYPPAFDARTLETCYAARWHRPYPAVADAAMWIHRQLLNHPARVASPGQAELLWVPSLAALSEAAGQCGGSSHFDRMAATAAALRRQEAFAQRPSHHLVINSVSSLIAH